MIEISTKSTETAKPDDSSKSDKPGDRKQQTNVNFFEEEKIVWTEDMKRRYIEKYYRKKREAAKKKQR